MNQEKSVKKNFFLNSVLTVATVLVPLITFPYISRVLLVEANGKVNFASSVINYFIMFSALGIPTYGIRACATVRDNKVELAKTVHELFFINLVMTVIVYIIFLVSVFMIPQFYNEKSLMIITSFNLLLNAPGMNWLYSALEEYKYITIRSLIVKFISVGLIFCLVKKPEDYKVYAIILMISNVGGNLFNLVYARKFVLFKRIQGYEIKKHIKPILTFFATTVAISIYSNLDIVMLGFVSGDVEVGYYSAALKIRTTLATLAVSLGTVLLPRLSYWVQMEQYDKFKKMLQKSFDYMFIIAIPITVYFIVFAKPAVLLISGAAYEGAVLPTQLLMPTIFLAGLSNVTGTQTMVPLGKENKLLRSIIVGALTDFILNLFFIPKYGSGGAAFATMITEGVVLLMQCIYIKQLLVQIRVGKYFRKPFFSCILAIAISLLVTRYFRMGYFGELLISASIFGGVYVLVLLISKEDLVMEVLNSLKRRKNNG